MTGARSDLGRFFQPRSIAIVGASRDLITISGQPLKHLTAHGYRGRLYPVNPRYPEILGVKCYPALADLPETPDLALILVNASRVADVLRQCGAKGVPYAMVFSSGFAESGAAGAAMQRELAAIAREYGIGVIGPNCQGMINAADRVYAGFGSVFNADYEAGAVSMVSQSGGFGFSVMNLSSLDGRLPFRYTVTTGNEIGVSTPDFMEYFIRDPGTEIVAVYIEGLKEARRLLDVGDAGLAAGKPILMWKVGNTARGQQAATAHTANPAGATALYRATCREKAITQVEDLQDLADYGRAFRCGRLPRGNRLAIITISGGAGILMTDEVIGRGMRLADLTPETVERLRKVVPSFGSLLNPVDVTAAIFNDLTLVNGALQAVVDDPGVDCVALINASLQGELAEKIAREIVAGAARTEKPVLVTWSARDEAARAAYALLEAARIPHYKSPVRCGRALAALSSYAEARRRIDARRGESALVLACPAAKAMVADGRSTLVGHAASRVLAEYGISVAREELAASQTEAQAAAWRVGLPVALKVQSPDIPREAEVAAARLDVASEGGVAAAYHEVLTSVRAYNGAAQIEGVRVQETVTGGIEVILGVTNDDAFGPAVSLSMGGMVGEALQDAAYRLTPVTRSMARDMVEEVRGCRLLAGARGRLPADIDALVDAMVRLSALAVDLADRLAEVSVAPLLVLPQGRGVKAVDAWIRLRAPQG